MTLNLKVEKWSRKTLRLQYEGLAGTRLCVTGYEVRALFRRSEEGMIAADIVKFRELVESCAKKE